MHEDFLIVASSAHRSLFFVGDNWNSHAIRGIPVDDRPVVAKYSPQSGYIYWMGEC